MTGVKDASLPDGFDCFFTPEPLFLSAGVERIQQFGIGHLAMVATCIALACALVLRYRKLPGGLERHSPRRRQLLLMAAISLGLLASRDITMVLRGLMMPVFWPLHICNFCEYFMFAYALHPHGELGRRLGDLLFCWALTGSLAAMLFPGWRYCPLLSYASIGGFAEHALLLAFSLCIVCGNDYQPNWRRFWFPALAATAGGLAFRMLNPLWGTNFFFVTNPESSGAPFVWAERTFEDPGYLAVYLLAAIAIWMASYGIWVIVSNRTTRSSSMGAGAFGPDGLQDSNER